MTNFDSFDSLKHSEEEEDLKTTTNNTSEKGATNTPPETPLELLDQKLVTREKLERNAICESFTVTQQENSNVCTRPTDNSNSKSQAHSAKDKTKAEAMTINSKTSLSE
jgi:hypothetical protein